MVKRLESKGFPCLWGWLFLTLTVDPDQFSCESAAYEQGCDRVRRMVYALRQLGFPIRRYFSKLELHESGFPHWHLGLDCSEYIPNDVVADAWGLGFTKTKRVKKQRDFKYLFKYVVKDNGEVPEWIMDYPRRIRVFQTSVGFYSAPTGLPKRMENIPPPEPEKVTLRMKFTEWNQRGVVRVRELSYRSVPVLLARHYVDLFIQAVESGARALDAYHIPLQIESIEEYVQPWIPNRKRRYRPYQRHSASERFQTEPTSLPGVLCQLSDENL
jgi:hypothetical protein